MSVQGKETLSFRRQDVKEQKSLAVGNKSLRFAHKSPGGETVIDLTSLTTPPEMTGFPQPSSAEIGEARVKFFRNNLRLISSDKGVLIDYLSYNVATSTSISLNFTTAVDEIIIGELVQETRAASPVVDAESRATSGTVSAGATTINTGLLFEINKHPSEQIGAVMVFIDGDLQLRNVGNATAAPAADGNYEEVPAAGGLGSIIELNSSEAFDRTYKVVPVGALVERPDGSMMAVIETLAGQIDAMVPVLADAAGVPESQFQANPNDVNLRQFGDKVLKHDQLYTAYVGSAAEVDAGLATHSSMTSAIAALSAGDSIYLLKGTHTEDVTVDKELHITGAGRSAVLAGTLDIDAAADFSSVQMIKTTGLITVDGDGSFIHTTWTTGGTPVDNGTGNDVKVIEE